jgi:hypothetical protein
MWIALLVLAAGVLFYTIVLTVFWPFTKQSLIDVLQESSLRTVTVQKFRSTVFPPGFVAEGIAFEHLKHKNNPPIIYIQKLTATASWGALLTFRHRLSNVTADGLHVVVPATAERPFMPLNHQDQSGSHFAIDTMRAQNALVEFAHPGKPLYPVKVMKVQLHGIGINSTIPYEIWFNTIQPPGIGYSKGVFGPWHPNRTGITSLRGTFSYWDANLAYFHVMSGTATAKGDFSGTLQSVRVKGDASVSHFKLYDTSHDRDLKVNFDLDLQGSAEKANLRSTNVQLDRTRFDLTGWLAAQGSQSDLFDVTVSSGRGRIQDLVDLFISGPESPMTGDIDFEGHIAASSGAGDFVKRLRISGDFDMSGAKFTDPTTERCMTRLSESATKNHIAAVLSSIRANVTARNGLAHLTQVSFTMPGAHSQLDGTYSLMNYSTNLYGVLVTPGDIADSTTGIKVFFADILKPFLKRRQGDKVVGFHLGGSYGKTSVRFDPDARKHFQTPPSKRS